MTRLRGELGDREVYGLLSVGFNGESEPLTSVADMASHYVREIRTVQPVGPYLLCGYSVGGLVAYEMAQQLLEDGDETRFVGLFETPLPTEYVFGPECEDAGLDVDTILSLDGLRWMEEDIESVARMRSELVSRRISDYEALCYVLDEMKPHLADVLSELKGRGLIVPTMEIAEFYRLREIWAKYLWAASVYKPSPSTQPVTLFRGDSPMAEDLERAWKRLVPVRSFVLQERHEQLLASSEVGALLKRCLDEAEADVLVAGA
jgi:pimeloyl-ACP methyl ester carboxylesterase